VNNLQQWGMELALLIRRRDAATDELTAVNAQIDAICQRISDEPTGTLYGTQTGEQPRIDPVEWAHGTSPAQKPRNQAPVPMSRPLRTDHQDGGSTFALTPIADTVTLPAVLPCPRTTGGQCAEQAIHVHTAMGVDRVGEMGVQG
jgi:hypothetical protein